MVFNGIIKLNICKLDEINMIISEKKDTTNNLIYNEVWKILSVR